MTIKFKKEYLIEELDVFSKSISDEIVDTRRWSEIHEIIFQLNDKFYMAWYSCGKTEQQAEYPWENEEEIECEEVHQVEKVVLVWESIE